MIKPLTSLRKYCILMVFSIITLSVGSAFAIVWMQQQISRTAQESKSLEAQLAETSRKLQFLDERIAGFHQPIVLQGKVAGSLRPSMENQVVFVEERELATGRAYAVVQPYEVSMDLALLEFNPNR
jgi:hypothetical protein